MPSGYIDRDAVGDPANIIVVIDDKDNISVRLLLTGEWNKLEIIKEVDIKGDFLIRALQFRNARIIYEQARVEFKERFSREMVTPDCDAFTFLDLGSVVL